MPEDKNQNVDASSSQGQFSNQDIAGSSDSQSGGKIKKFDFFKKGVTTMQDDIADLISKKNNKKSKKEPEFKKDIQRNLADVYTDGDGKIPDLTRLEKMQRPLWKTILYAMIVVLIFLLGAAVAGFYYFSNVKGDTFTNERVTLKIDAPMTVVSGQDGVYTITITNKEKVNLYNARLELFYPDSMKYVSSEPVATGDNKNIWEFNVLKIGESTQIKLTAQMVAALHSTQTIKGVLSFKPANLNAVFQQQSIIDAAVSSSTLPLQVTGPDNALGNQAIEYTVTFTNSSKADIVNAQVLTEYPDGFVFASADPIAQPGENNNTWNFDLLKAGESKSIKIKGNYSAAKDGGNKELKAYVQIKQNDGYISQSESSFITNVVQDQLSVQLIVNGSGEDQAINFGDLLVYSLSYKNTGQNELKNVSITAKINSQILDGKTLNDAYKGTVNQNSITWTGQQIPKLLRLGPGEEGEITWSVRVRDSSVINDKNVNQFTVESTAEAQAEQMTGSTTESMVKSKTVVNSINSDLDLAARTQYYNEDNVALGSGPIEPKVDEKSSYNVVISLANNLHDINNIVVVASLPQNVIWDNREDHNTGNVVYNPQTKKITWSISRLPKSANKAEASFSLGIKPTDSDFGKILILVSDVTLTAKDGNTGSDLNKSLKAVTTTFDDPIVGQVSGIVK